MGRGSWGVGQCVWVTCWSGCVGHGVRVGVCGHGVWVMECASGCVGHGVRVGVCGHGLWVTR